MFEQNEPPLPLRFLCQGEECWDSLGLIFVREDGEQDVVYGGSILEGPHGPGSAPDFTEASLDGVGSAHGFALRSGFVAETGEQVVEVVFQAGDGLGDSDIETTARYAHLARDSVHEAAERIADSIAADIL